MDKLLNLCINLQSKDYNRLKRPVHDLFKIKMRIQRKEYKVLALDDELLLFLIALVVGSDKRIRMDELYCRFK
jgi:DNA phosphorothioation-dependent restriction protein DptG